MKQYEVFMNLLGDDLRACVNAIGWSAAAEKHPAVEAYLRLAVGGEGGQAMRVADAPYYLRVGRVAAVSPEDAFRILNTEHPGGWAARSLCVGDIIREVGSGTFLMVATFGLHDVSDKMQGRENL
ncbi:hypothetical protein A3709_19005 [Halioglobus sp. HI00S01]|uniref:hypothetical protein n=1 Tax=Halioglobus sp. HI00S01 TaxID=1822214 RepID=UPI0007C3DEDD|nr:hypothetical protein [Halioglobus sp. HI00S01]KZX57714.1 hypothetical protein A3709_19005 [Halioglobus sp. HI00S01]